MFLNNAEYEGAPNNNPSPQFILELPTLKRTEIIKTGEMAEEAIL